MAWAAIRNIGEPAHIIRAGNREAAKPACIVHHTGRMFWTGTAKGIVPKVRNERGRKVGKILQRKSPSHFVYEDMIASRRKGTTP